MCSNHKLKQLDYLQIKDPKEKLLFDNMINAQYEYLTYIRPIKCNEISLKIKDKAINPFHWKAKYMDILCDNNSDEKNNSDDKKDIKKQYKKLLLTFHPDKNPDQKELAEEYFKKLTSLIETNEVEILDLLEISDNPWKIMENIMDTNGNYYRLLKINKFMSERWFT